MDLLLRLLQSQTLVLRPRVFGGKWAEFAMRFDGTDSRLLDILMACFAYLEEHAPQTGIKLLQVMLGSHRIGDEDNLPLTFQGLIKRNSNQVRSVDPFHLAEAILRTWSDSDFARALLEAGAL